MECKLYFVRKFGDLGSEWVKISTLSASDAAEIFTNSNNLHSGDRVEVLGLGFPKRFKVVKRTTTLVQET